MPKCSRTAVANPNQDGKKKFSLKKAVLACGLKYKPPQNERQRTALRMKLLRHAVRFPTKHKVLIARLLRQISRSDWKRLLGVHPRDVSKSENKTDDYKKLSSIICKAVGQLLVKSKQPDKTYSVQEAQVMIARVLKALPIPIDGICRRTSMGEKSYYSVCTDNYWGSYPVRYLMRSLCKKLRVVFPNLFFHYTSDYVDDDVNPYLIERILIDESKIVC